MKRKWSRGEKALFLAPVLFVALVWANQLVPRDRVFRGDVFDKKYNFWKARESGGPRGCGTNLKQIGLGFLQYSQDYDEKLPPVATRGAFYGWADQLWPYIRSNQVLHCRVARSPIGTLPKAANYTDYWMNSNLNGFSMTLMNQPANVILAGEGNDGIDLTDARYAKSQLPPSWLSNKNSPAFRHLSDEVWAIGGGWYLFSDGHVKIVRPHDFSTAPRSGVLTFTPK